MVVVGLILALSSASAEAPDAKRFALLIANGDYKDASLQVQATNEDTDVLAEELNRDGFDVDLKKDLDLERFRAALTSFIARIVPGSTALLYFNGIGIQVAHQTFLIPVNTSIRSEADIKNAAISLDETLAAMNRRGANVKIIIIDASRRNKIELNFRGYSAGLSSIETPEGTLAMFATAPNKVATKSESAPSLFMSELVKELRAPDVNIEDALMHTRVGVSRASNGEQVPWVASSLVEPFYLAATSTSPSEDARTPAPSGTSPANAVASARTPDTPPPVSKAPTPQPAPAATPPIGPSQQKLAATPQEDEKGPAVAAKESPTTNQAVAPPPQTQPPQSPPAVGTNDKAPSPTVAMTPAPIPLPNSGAPSVPSEAGKPGSTFRDCADCPEMMTLAAGSFLMGDGSTMFDRPVHRVTISKPFAIGVAEVTFADWNKCVEAGGCKVKPDDQGFGKDQHPVMNISWFDAKEYIVWLSKATGKTYRLPSEAEWEFAARAGTRTAYSWGASLGPHLANCADCGGNGEKQGTLPVKSFPPNAYGLYDMAGNVAEWAEDCWNQSYSGAPNDGSAWLTGDCGQRVLRGGSFDSAATYTKPSARFRYDADVRYWGNGFRLVRELP